MENELKGIKYLLFIIVLVLVFGSSAVSGMIGFIFWAIVIIAVTGLVLWGIGTIIDNKPKEKILGNEISLDGNKRIRKAKKKDPQEISMGLVILLTLGIMITLPIIMSLVLHFSPNL